MTGVGIGEAGSALYQYLIENGPLPLSDVLESFGNSAQTSLERLQEVGLVVGDPLVARHPDYALRPMLAQAEYNVVRLKARADELRDLYESSTGRGPNAPVEELTSRQRIASTLDDLQLGAHREVLQFITWPFVPLTALHAPGDPARRNPDGSVRRPRRRLVYERSVLNSESAMAGLRHAAMLGADVRVAKNLPFKLIISDRETAMVPRWPRGYSDQGSTLLIRGGALVESMIVVFEQFWNEAVPLNTDKPSRAADKLDKLDMSILRYIVAGQTDEQMARLLDTSKSTILRRIKRMRELAGAESRPALIFHAARHWMD